MSEHDGALEAATAAIQDELAVWWTGDQDSRLFAVTLARAALDAALPDERSFLNAIDALIIASENATTFSGRLKRDRAIDVLWRLVYGQKEKPV